MVAADFQSERVLLTLVSKGISLGPAYKIVQENAHRPLGTPRVILELLSAKYERVIWHFIPRTNIAKVALIPSST
jgi:hypothetical protein